MEPFSKAAEKRRSREAIDELEGTIIEERIEKGLVPEGPFLVEISRPTERGLNNFFRRWSGFVVHEIRLVLEWILKQIDESVKGSIVIPVGGLNGFLDAVVARNVDGVGPLHQVA